MKNKILVVCTTDSMITNFLIPHIKDLKARGFQVDCACSQTGDYINIIRNNGIFAHQVDFHRQPFSIGNIKAFRQLNQIVKTGGYNVVFCHEPVGGVMGRVVGRLNHCLVIDMAHGFYYYKGAPKKNIIFHWVEKFLSRWTDVLITINQEDYDTAKGFHCENVVKINGIGVDTSKFTHAPNKDYLTSVVGCGAVVLLSVGELIPRKNHEVIIRALVSLNDDSIHYVIVGEGQLLEHLKELTASLRLTKQVHFLGYRKDINQLCNACDIFVIPSLSEGLSVALMEAMSTGNAIIASNIRGNMDLVDNGKGGYLVGAMDIKEYTNAIKILAGSSELREQMGRYNLERIKDFDICYVRKQMEDIFDSVFDK